MLAKPFRFHGYASLRYAYTHGQQVRLKQASLKYCENKRRQHSRCAVVISKKVTKKAPVRNRIRRRIYEIVREQWPLLRPAHDMVITVFDEKMADMSAQDLNHLIKQLLKKANLYT